MAINPISQATLANISGQTTLEATNDLLDNTLQTFQTKKWAESMDQEAELRKLQITREAEELAEWQKAADTRELERIIAQKTADYTLNNIDTEFQLKDDLRSLASNETALKNFHTTIDRLLTTPNNYHYQTMLEDSYDKGYLSPDQYELYKQYNFDNEKDKRAFAEHNIQDRAYLQELMLEQEKSSMSIDSTWGYTNDITQLVSMYKEGFGVKDGIEADEVAKITVDTARSLAPVLPRKISPTEALQYVGTLLKDNPDRYRRVTEEGYFGTSFGEESMIDKIRLMEDARYHILRDNGALPGSMYNGTSQNTGMSHSLGITPEDMNKLMTNPVVQQYIQQGMTPEQIYQLYLEEYQK